MHLVLCHNILCIVITHFDANCISRQSPYNSQLVGSQRSPTCTGFTVLVELCNTTLVHSSCSLSLPLYPLLQWHCLEWLVTALICVIWSELLLACLPLQHTQSHTHGNWHTSYFCFFVCLDVTHKVFHG